MAALVEKVAVTITYHPNVVQGGDEWLAMRCGVITASEMKLLLTPTLKIAANDKQRAHLFELAAQRISRFVEPHYVSDDMLRGQEDEFFARHLYAEKIAPVSECGFITRDFGPFVIGYSPDALVGDDGLIECKSRRQKYQVETIASGEMPAEYMLQCQTGLLVTGRKWLDFCSYSNGLPMIVIRIYPDDAVQGAIAEAVDAAERSIAALIETYHANCAMLRTYPTERRIIQEMF